MTNKYFPDEEITQNDLYFMCYMIERVARHLHQHNKYVVNKIGRDHSSANPDGKGVCKADTKYVRGKRGFRRRDHTCV